MNSTSEQRPPSWTITRLLEWTKDHLERNHVEDARLATEVLLAHALGCSRIDLYTKFDQVPAQEKLDRFTLSRRRSFSRSRFEYRPMF